jgi:hypothetical protein
MRFTLQSSVECFFNVMGELEKGTRKLADVSAVARLLIEFTSGTADEPRRGMIR